MRGQGTKLNFELISEADLTLVPTIILGCRYCKTPCRYYNGARKGVAPQVGGKISFPIFIIFHNCYKVDASEAERNKDITCFKVK